MHRARLAVEGNLEAPAQGHPVDRREGRKGQVQNPFHHRVAQPPHPISLFEGGDEGHFGQISTRRKDIRFAGQHQPPHVLLLDDRLKGAVERLQGRLGKGIRAPVVLAIVHGHNGNLSHRRVVEVMVEQGGRFRHGIPLLRTVLSPEISVLDAE